MFAQFLDSSKNSQSKTLFGLNDRVKNQSIPLQSIVVNCFVQDSFVKLQICQTYQNTFDYPLEIEYVFPVSSDASVSSLQIKTDAGLVIDAVIEEKEEAQEKYQDSISQGNTAFLASYDKDDSSDRMLLYIGNLQPNQRTTVIITYIGICAIEQSSQVIFIPCTFTPNYKGKKELNYILGQLFSPTPVDVVDQVPYKISIECDLYYQQKQILLVQCHSHKINTVQETPNHWKISLDSTQAYEFDKDFILKFQTEDQFAPRFLLQKSKDNQIAGFISFIPQLSQKSDGTGEFIFVLDRSGSMQGTRIQMAKQAAILFLKSLPMDCKFNIVSFGSSFAFMFPTSTKYTDQTLNQAINLIQNFSADMGGTEILNPLAQIFQQPIDPNFPRTIFLLTDGEVSQPELVVNKIEANSEECRVHTFGIGDGVSTQLINECAKAGRGKSNFIKDGENIQAKVIESLKMATQPVLTFENIDWGGLKVEQVPQKPSYFYSNELTYLFFFMEQVQQPIAEIKINCKNTQIQAQKFTHSVIIDFDSIQSEDTLHKLIARYKIKELEKDSQKNKQTIISLSTKYQILSTLTSFIGKKTNTNPTQQEMQFIKIPIQKPKDHAKNQPNRFQNSFYYFNQPQQLLMCCAPPQQAQQCAMFQPNIQPSLQQNVQTNSCFGIQNFSQQQYLSTIQPQGNCLQKMQDIPSFDLYAPQIQSQPNLPQFPMQQLNYQGSTQQVNFQFSQPQAAFLNLNENFSFQQSQSNQYNKALDFQQVQKSKASGYMDIVLLQSAQGSWSFSEKLAQLLQLNQQKLVSQKPNEVQDLDVWVTIIVILYFETYHSQQKQDLEMVIMKAQRWLESKGIQDTSNYMISFKNCLSI